MTNYLCNKCGECCLHIKADFDSKILYWDEKQPLTDEFASMLIETPQKGVYRCKFLKDNLCTNIKKPDICINYPSSPFAELTDNCTFCGLIFIKQEHIKQKIRKLKEEILHYQALIDFSIDKKEKNQLQKIIIAHQKYIDKYKDYGSENW